MKMSRTFAYTRFVLGFLMLKYGADAVFYDKVTVHTRAGPAVMLRPVNQIDFAANQSDKAGDSSTHPTH